MDLHIGKGIVSGLAVAVALSACGGSGNGAEPTPSPEPAPAPAPAPDPGGERQISISPTSGTTSTDVTVRASGFPANSRVRIGFGPPESEYEVFTDTTADSDGRVTTTVSVPDWAESGRDYLFVAVGPSNVEAISSRFTVRD